MAYLDNTFLRNIPLISHLEVNYDWKIGLYPTDSELSTALPRHTFIDYWQFLLRQSFSSSHDL